MKLYQNRTSKRNSFWNSLMKMPNFHFKLWIAFSNQFITVIGLERH
ncbi:hypothetical protein V7654_09815 [Bacillus sp. JJ1609]